MAEYDNNMTGVLFKHDKGGNEKRPDYKGSCEINGTPMWISAWIRDKKDGSGKFMSLKFEPKDAPKQDAHNTAKSNGYAPESDDIPF